MTITNKVTKAVMVTVMVMVAASLAAPAVFAEGLFNPLQESSRGVGRTPDEGLFDLGKENPLGTTKVVDLLNSILRSLTFVAVPIAVFMIIVGAFQMLSAGGDPEKFKRGRNTILYAAIGFAVFLAARLLIGLSAEILGAKPEILEQIRK